jgi:hypothetical protein
MIIFGICSSINGPNKGIYSIDQRFSQTLETINSIRKYVSNAYLILIDNSELPEIYVESLTKNVDLFISDKFDFNDKSNNESRQMIKIIEKIKYMQYDIFFKISGRYTLIEKFDINIHLNNGINFREFIYGSDDHCYTTVLYSFSKSNENIMIECYNKLINSNYRDIEHGIYDILNKYVNKIDYIGVTGNIAPSGQYLEH